MTNVGLIVLGFVLAVQVSSAYELAVPVFKQSIGDGDINYTIGGERAKKDQFPYHAAITLGDAFFCGGSLINRRCILTAGHCVWGIKKWVVVLGAQKIYDRSEPGHVAFVCKKGIVHDMYDHHTMANDIGLVALPRQVELNDRINIIPLPPISFKNENFVGKTVRVSGWGKTSDWIIGINPYLQFVDLVIVDHDVCKKVYGDIIGNTQFCCFGEGQKSTCTIDSGSAVTIGSGENLTHLGIVSFGSNSGCSMGYPTGVTSTPAFLGWILHHTGIPVHGL